MKVKITTDRRPFVDGKQTNKGDVVEVSATDAKVLIANGFAVEEATKKPTKKKAAPKRARKANGQLKADDPSTPDVNEAWQGGKAPK